jgi:hypothetical protein
MAGWRVGGSAGGRRRSPLSPVCQPASIVERQWWLPVLDRHSVVLRQCALSVLDRHSAVCDRQPTPSGGNAGRASRRAAVSLHGPDGSAGCCCAQASARIAQFTASGMGSRLPVSVTEPGLHGVCSVGYVVRVGSLWGSPDRRSRGSREPRSHSLESTWKA